MKLTIDTQNDSEEEIKHAIEMLRRVVEKSSSSNYSSSERTDSSEMFFPEEKVMSNPSVVSDLNFSSESKEPESSPEQETSGFFNMFDQKTETEYDDSKSDEETVVIEDDINSDVEVQIVPYD